MSSKCFSQHPSPQDKGKSPTAIWVPPTLFQGGGSVRLQALSWISQPPKTPLPSIADRPPSLLHTNPSPSECLGDSSLYHYWQHRSRKHLSDSSTRKCDSFYLLRAQQVPGLEAKNLSAEAGDMGLIPGSGRSSGERNGNPLQYSCLGNPMDGGAWWATIQRVAKSQLNNN